MEKIIYNTKLKKLIIAILIVMLVINFISPIVYAMTFMSFDPKQYIYDQGDIPSNADKIFDWSLEEWKLTDAEFLIMKKNYASQKLPADGAGATEYNASIDQFLYAYEQRICNIQSKVIRSKI